MFVRSMNFVRDLYAHTRLITHGACSGVIPISVATRPLISSLNIHRLSKRLFSEASEINRSSRINNVVWTTIFDDRENNRFPDWDQPWEPSEHRHTNSWRVTKTNIQWLPHHNIPSQIVPYAVKDFDNSGEWTSSVGGLEKRVDIRFYEPTPSIRVLFRFSARVINYQSHNHPIQYNLIVREQMTSWYPAVSTVSMLPFPKFNEPGPVTSLENKGIMYIRNDLNQRDYSRTFTFGFFWSSREIHRIQLESLFAEYQINPPLD